MKEKNGFFGMKQNFGNMAELMKNATLLDSAIKVPVACDLKEDVVDMPHWVEVPDKFAVWNINEGKMASVVSKGYNVLLHEDLIKTVANTLTNLGLSIKGTVINKNNRVHANILIDKEVEMAGEKFMLGFRITNSYDKKTGIKGEFYGVRLACNNGMLLTNFGEVVLSESHNTTKDVDQLVVNLVKNSVKVSSQLKTVIEEAMATSMEWAMANIVLENLLKKKKYVELLQDHLAKEYAGQEHLTKWDVYNAITSIITHDRSISYCAAMKLEKNAQTLLEAKEPQLQKLAIIQED